MFDESQPEPPTEFDTNNHTRFHPDDIEKPGEDRRDGLDTNEDLYRRLASLNRGVYNGKWGDNSLLRAQDNKAILDAVAGFLELTPIQKRVARFKMAEAPLQKWSSPNGVDGALVAICICEGILRNDHRSDRSYSPRQKPENADPKFIDLLNGLDYRQSTIQSCHQKVLEHMEWESVNWERVDRMKAD